MRKQYYEFFTVLKPAESGFGTSIMILNAVTYLPTARMLVNIRFFQQLESYLSLEIQLYTHTYK